MRFFILCKTFAFLCKRAKNAKAEYANYNNINALHFCILHFAMNGCAD